MVHTHIQGPVLVIRVLQAERVLLELLPLVGQGVLRLVELEALPREAAAALDALPFLAAWEGESEREIKVWSIEDSWLVFGCQRILCMSV